MRPNLSWSGFIKFQIQHYEMYPLQVNMGHSDT